eukprot:m.197711 g.197711  ORF g.197711 m.197711 type:complete len:54 (-) comp53769_c0_seq13:354-515(-)
MERAQKSTDGSSTQRALVFSDPLGAWRKENLKQAKLAKFSKVEDVLFIEWSKR